MDSKYYKIIDRDVDIDIIKKELSQNQFNETYCLQGLNKTDHPQQWLVKDNSNKDASTRAHSWATPDQFVEPLFDYPYTNSLLKKYGIGYSRVMILSHRSCYTYHKDAKVRIHIPIETNEDNFFVMNDEVFRLPANGNVYEVDTKTYMHTFVNASLQLRTHIVGTLI
jgi:hypothetical protein